MKNITLSSAGIATVIALLVSAAGCGHSQTDPAASPNGVAPSAASSLTPQQQQATQEAQQREAAARGAADHQQQSQHH